jgi:hypothetical protein
MEVLSEAPNASLVNGRAQLLDLAGDGLVDLVDMKGPTYGFYRRTDDACLG